MNGIQCCDSRCWAPCWTRSAIRSCTGTSDSAPLLLRIVVVVVVVVVLVVATAAAVVVVVAVIILVVIVAVVMVVERGTPSSKAPGALSRIRCNLALFFPSSPLPSPAYFTPQYIPQTSRTHMHTLQLHAHTPTCTHRHNHKHKCIYKHIFPPPIPTTSSGTLRTGTPWAVRTPRRHCLPPGRRSRGVAYTHSTSLGTHSSYAHIHPQPPFRAVHRVGHFHKSPTTHTRAHAHIYERKSATCNGRDDLVRLGAQRLLSPSLCRITSHNTAGGGVAVGNCPGPAAGPGGSTTHTHTQSWGSRTQSRK